MFWGLLREEGVGGFVVTVFVDMWREEWVEVAGID